MLLLDQIRLVVHGGDHGVDVGQFAPQTEIGGRTALQLFDHVAPAYGHLLDRTARGTGRHGGRHVAQGAVELRPLAQEAALGTAAGGVIGVEQRGFETLRRIDLLGVLPFGIGIGAQHAAHGGGQALGSLHLLFQLLAREVAQRIVRRAPRAQRSDILTIVVAVQQTHLSRIRSRNAVENLPDDGFGVETLGVGVEGVLLQSGYQTIIFRCEHTRYALKSMSETFSRRYSPSRASKSASENEM